MEPGKRWLLIGGGLTALASVLHVGIVLGGPDWYRAFGAGERMARLAAQGLAYPLVLTLCIAAVLGVWALYAFSGAAVIRRLPLVRPVLASAAAVFLARGLFGIPVVLIADAPYAHELRNRMTFMIVTSAACTALGVCYALGARLLSSPRSAVTDPCRST